MDYSNLELKFSAPRLQRYLNACGSSHVKAEGLYKANLQISKSFYPVLNLFEVALRNSIDENLATYFGDYDWIINQQSGFMNNSSLRRGKYFLKHKVRKSEQKITSKGLSITSDRIISELGFGFWGSFFEPQHYSLIAGSIINCFPHKPTHINRTNISNNLYNIRKFRNRIYHNEPICFSRSSINFNHPMNIRRKIRELSNWMDPSLLTYINTFDDIDVQVALARRI